MAGIEEAFEKFSDRLAREESKRYSRDEQGDYVEEVQDPYPIKLGPLELGANANMSTGKFSPNEYQNVSTMNRNVGLRGKYNVPDSGIALLGSIGDVRSSSKNKLNLPFNPMTGEAESYSETMRDVYKESPYSVGAQYNPKGTDQLFSALYNKGGGYNLGYNQGPVNVSYTSNPGLGNNVMLRGQYNFADGGVASMFRERPGYQEGGALSPSVIAPSGIEYELVTGKFSGKPVYRPKYNPSRSDIVYYEMDPKDFFEIVMATGVSTPTTTEIPTIDPFSGQPVSAQDQAAFARIDPDKDIHAMNDFYSRLERLGTNAEYTGQSADEIRQSLLSDLKMAERSGSDQSISQDLISNTNLKLSLLDNYVNNLKKSPEVPTVDPFSGQQVSAQDQSSFANVGGISPEDFLKENPGYVVTNLTDIAGVPRFNAYKPEVPTVDPFSGQQVSAQDQMAFTQPQPEIFPQQNIFQQPSPVDQFIGERRFQSEADAAARSGIPFTKTIQDYLPNIGYNVPGHMDYISQIREAGLPASEYHRLGTADLIQRNIDQLPSILKPIAGAIAPVTAFASSIPYELTQASQRMQPGSGLGGFYDAYINESPLVAASNRFIGAAQPLANQIQNLLSPVANSAQRSQQEASARVMPTRMSYGGRVSMSDGGLTTMIAPAKGPDSQGVESLFRRRYN